VIFDRGQRRRSAAGAESSCNPAKEDDMLGYIGSHFDIVAVIAGAFFATVILFVSVEEALRPRG